MKIILLALFALAGTAIANPGPGGSLAARSLLDLVTNGMKSWGLAGTGNPPTRHPFAPSRNMPGGLPELTRHHPPKQDGVPGTPGNPLGPRKKQGRIYPRVRSRSCTMKRGMQCSAGTTATGRTSRYPKLRLNGRGGAMVAFANLSPHAHAVLAAVQKWDDPVSRAVAWFDGAMADLQESIGGKHVPEIDGNELKLWLICLFRSNNPRYPDAVDKACERQKSEPVEEQKQRQAINGLNEVAELCEKVEEAPPTDENMRTEALEHCDKFAKTLENMIDSNAGLILLGEWARARTLNNHGIEAHDQLIAKEFIQKGAFGPALNETEADEVATLYLEHMSTNAIIEIEQDGVEELIKHDKPPSWLELLQMGAGYIPQDRAAVNEALALLEGSPHLRHLDKEGRDSLLPVSTCWDQAGLLAFQPRRWDLISAAMVYLEGKLRDTESTLSCAPCAAAPSGFWLLRCGSAFPYP